MEDNHEGSIFSDFAVSFFYRCSTLFTTQISGWYLGLRSAFFTSGPSCSCTPSSGRDSSFLRLPAHVARRRAGHISSVPSHDRISFAPRPRVDGGAVGDCNWDDLSSPSNILFNLSHGRNTFPNTSGGSPLLGRHRQWYVIHRIFYALDLSSRYLSRGSRDLYVSLLIISSSHTSNLSLVFRFRSQAWSIRPRGRSISHFLHLHDLLDALRAQEWRHEACRACMNSLSECILWSRTMLRPQANYARRICGHWKPHFPTHP